MFRSPNDVYSVSSWAVRDSYAADSHERRVHARLSLLAAERYALHQALKERRAGGRSARRGTERPMAVGGAQEVPAAELAPVA